jgi:hypothetical protein
MTPVPLIPTSDQHDFLFKKIVPMIPNGYQLVSSKMYCPPRGLLMYLFDKGFRATLEQLQNSEGPKSVEFWNEAQ